VVGFGLKLLGSVGAGYWKLDSGLDSHLRGRNITALTSFGEKIIFLGEKYTPQFTGPIQQL
jgi:hypothetical protein